jgi:hypothetical protein
MTIPHQPKFAGRLIGGRFRLDAKLDTVSGGVAYAATDQPSNTPVQVTLLWADALADTPARAALIRLRHPRVARFLDAGIDEGQVWCATEALDHRFLIDENRSNPLSTGRALALTAAVCEGVSARGRPRARERLSAERLRRLCGLGARSLRRRGQARERPRTRHRVGAADARLRRLVLRRPPPPPDLGRGRRLGLLLGVVATLAAAAAALAWWTLR